MNGDHSRHIAPGFRVLSPKLLREVVRMALRRLRNRLIKPVLQNQQRLEAELQHVISRHEAELQLLRGMHQSLVESLACQLNECKARLGALEANALRHSDSILWLAEQHHSVTAVSTTATQTPSGLPRVSVVMPVWNRADRVGRAIESVLSQTNGDWELLVIDDGSMDRTAEVVGSYLSDPRIRYRYQPHAGAAAARNLALAESRGEVIAYLDSDNTWYPGVIDAIARAFEDRECESAYFAQIWRDHSNESSWIPSFSFDFAALLEARIGIDLNVFAHRRRLFERLGGFDSRLTRLIDWDLVLRYTAEREPKRLPVMGCRYEDGRWDRISTRENVEYNRFLVLQNFNSSPSQAQSLRVLYALREYPQLSQSHIATEIACMQRWGVHVDVWTETEPAALYSTPEKIYRGSLAEAIERAQPDVIHTHWLTMAVRYRDEVERAGLPLTVRGHGFEFTPELLPHLEADPVIRAYYIFPHFVPSDASRLIKMRAVSVCFNPHRYWPGMDKDPRLVLRAGAGLPSNDLQLFIRVAKACPEHRFVMALARTSGRPEFIEEIISYNQSLGTPVDLRVNVPPREMELLMHRAGIYFHTHSADSMYGMPISIGEAMATGAYVIGRRCSAAEWYIGNPAQCYDDEAAATRLVQETATWSEEHWDRLSIQAVDRAYGHFVDSVVLRPMLDDWLRLVAEARSRTSQIAA